MGLIYTAKQTAIDRTIAIKMLRPDMPHDEQTRARFLAEAAVIGDLEHPNIVPVYDLGVDPHGRLFYAMKKIQGTPWSQVIGAKALQENIQILQRVCDAVAFAHSRGVLHLDIKPENVMLGEFGEVLLMDWGLAASVADEAKAERLSQIPIGGTALYMAPEMAQGDVERMGFTSDVYLLGAVLYEIVAGKPPHAGTSAMNCLYNAAQNLIVPTKVKGELLEIALKAMVTEPAGRYQSVAELKKALAQYERHRESTALTKRGIGTVMVGDDFTTNIRAAYEH